MGYMVIFSHLEGISNVALYLSLIIPKIAAMKCASLTRKRFKQFEVYDLVDPQHSVRLYNLF